MLRLAAAILALAAVALSGPALLAAALPAHARAGVRRGLILCIGSCIGVSLWAAVGVAVFFLRRFSVPSLMAGDALLAALAGLALVICRRISPPSARPIAAPADSEVLSRPLLIILLLAITASVALFLLHTHQRPDGLWDAWSIWNLRARFLYAGSPHAFDAAFPHADYPPLWPVLIARIGLLVGAPSTRIPVLCGGIAAALLLGTLSFGIAWMRGPRTGALAALVLLGTQEFLNHAADQYADVPLASLFLAAAVLVAILLNEAGASPLPLALLAGLLAAAATLVKNEGAFHFLGLLAGISVGAICFMRRRAVGAMAMFLAGALPLLVLLGVFKIAFAPPNDLLTGRAPFALAEDADSPSPSEAAGVKHPPPLANRLTDPRRYAAIAMAMLNRILRVDRWNLFLLVFVGSLCFRARDTHGRAGRLALAIALLLTGVGYFGAYVVTPHDLTWHLNTSINRLILQAWPVMLLLAAMRLPFKPEDELASPRILLAGAQKETGDSQARPPA
jgi:hypothetical protein